MGVADYAGLVFAVTVRQPRRPVRPGREAYERSRYPARGKAPTSWFPSPPSPVQSHTEKIGDTVEIVQRIVLDGDSTAPSLLSLLDHDLGLDGFFESPLKVAEVCGRLGSRLPDRAGGWLHRLLLPADDLFEGTHGYVVANGGLGQAGPSFVFGEG